MPRFYPENDCDFYQEKLIDCFHDGKPHILRNDPLKNQVSWFRDQDDPDPNRSVICSWGIGENFEENTGLRSKTFLKSRIRKRFSLPTAGRRGLWKISRTNPCGLGKQPLHTWKLEDWLKQSAFRMSRTSNKDSVSSSQAS